VSPAAGGHPATTPDQPHRQAGASMREPFGKTTGPGALGHGPGPAAAHASWSPSPGGSLSAAGAQATPHPETAPAAADLAMADPGTLDRLAQRIYGRLRGHLAAELLADRERAQLLTDL
jgi:hypothetical protein